MPLLSANGLQICCDDLGPRRGAPLVLVGSLGMQATSWPRPFLDALAERGFRLIVFDHRDAGLSEGFEHAGRPRMSRVLAARLLGLRGPAPYTLSDMAGDVAGLIQALGLESAHLLGVSMGGAIAQLAAIGHPERVRSLTLVSSTAGGMTLPRPSRAARAALAVPLPDPTADVQSYLDAVVRLLVSLGSPGWTPDPEEIRARLREDLARAWRPDGTARQRAAMLAAPGRERLLARLRLPATVIHGRQDPLYRIEAGRAVAAAIPGAEMVEIDGMGHDLPGPIMGEIARLAARTAARAGARMLPGAPLARWPAALARCADVGR